MRSPCVSHQTEPADALPQRAVAFSRLPAERWRVRLPASLVVESSFETGSRLLPGVAASRVTPQPVRAPQLLAWSSSLGEELGLKAPATPDDVAVLAGNCVLPGMVPYASRYGGHQFGHWAGQLGDGRAIVLGTVSTRRGEWLDLQLKGAGPTPYARRADGRAVLRSSLREFVCSEAMHHLGIATTRALSLVTTGETVVRDMFYDGHPRSEPGAVVCRVAPSFIRFGHFQIHAAEGEDRQLRQLFDAVLDWHHPEIAALHDPIEQVERWFELVCERTAALMADWMRVGFVHGVMNTDNLSVLGLTIDYGPYGWLEGFEPLWTPNTTDASGRRYCYGRQPDVAAWNLARLAESLQTLGLSAAAAEHGLNTYQSHYAAHWQRQLSAKLGIPDLSFSVAEDEALLNELFALLAMTETDWTLFYRGLAHGLSAWTGHGKPEGEKSAPPDVAALGGLASSLEPAFYLSEAHRPSQHGRELMAWLRRYGQRLLQTLEPSRPDALGMRIAAMNAVNPWIVPRNYLTQQTIEAAEQGDIQPLHRLMEAIERPYDERAADADLAARRPEWARDKAGCSMLSCSS